MIKEEKHIVLKKFIITGSQTWNGDLSPLGVLKKKSQRPLGHTQELPSMDTGGLKRSIYVGTAGSSNRGFLSLGKLHIFEGYSRDNYSFSPILKLYCENNMKKWA